MRSYRVVLPVLKLLSLSLLTGSGLFAQRKDFTLNPTDSTKGKAYLNFNPRTASPNTPVVTSGIIDTVLDISMLHFEPNKPILDGASRMALPSFIRSLQPYRDKHLSVIGYCHSYRPITKASDPLFRLSVDRAKLIYTYLVDEGFDPAKLTWAGAGNSDPIFSNATTLEEAKENMRIEIIVFKP